MAKSRPKFRESSDAKRYATLLLVVFLGALFSILGYKIVQNEEQARLAALFERRGQDFVNRFQRGMEYDLTILEFLGGLFDSSESVGPEEFRRFVADLLSQHPEIRILAWAPRSRNSGHAGNSCLPDKTFFPAGLRPTQSDSKGAVPDRDGDEFLIRYVEPVQRHRDKIGANLTLLPANVQAMKWSRRTGRPVSTQPSWLTIQGTDDLRCAVFCPVYRRRPPRSNSSNQKTDVQGFVVAFLDLDQLFSISTQGHEEEGLEIGLYARTTYVQNDPVYLRASNASSMRSAKVSSPLPDQQLRWVSALERAGCQWTLLILPRSLFMKREGRKIAWMVLIMGFLLTLTLGVYLSVIINRRVRIERLVENRTAQLLAVNRQLEEEILERQKERQQLRQIIANAPVAMAMFDTSMRYITHSRKWLSDYNLGENSLVGKLQEEVFPDIPDRWRAIYQKAKSGEVITLPEDVFERADGTCLYLRWAAQPWYEAHEQIGGIIVATERVDDLVKAREAAIEASRLKSEFLANMSHEIRTPMNGIIGMTELALGTSLNPEQREYLEMVKASADSLLMLINDILDFSKIEAGRLELDYIPFNIRDELGEALKALALRANQKGLELIYSVDPGVPPILVGDPGRLRQVLVNLVGNAVKFTETGEVLVQVSLIPTDQTERGEEEGCWLHLFVRDTGIGIPDSRQQIIFEAFAQMDGSTTRKYGGSGLGLTISSQLVKLMRGRIWVESQPGKGSTFHFTVRFELPKTRAREVDVNLLARTTGKRVLVVDDNSTCCQALEQMLAELEMKPLSVTNARAAMRVTEESMQSPDPFELFFLDAHMPGEDGFMLAEQLQQEGRFSHGIILLLSPLSQREDATRCMQLGLTAHHLTKPVVPGELRKALFQILEAGPVEIRPKFPQRVSLTPPLQPKVRLEQFTLCQEAPRLHILLAEDNPVNQRLALRLLEKWGYRVTIAGNGRETLAVLDEQDIDLILMDIQMPEMDGLEATAMIRAKEQQLQINKTTISRTSSCFQKGRPHRRIPIVAMTAYAMKGDRERCLAAGMDGYISKPIQADELRRMISQFVPRIAFDGRDVMLASPSAEVIRSDRFLDQSEGDRDFMAEIAGLFLEGYPKQLQCIREALRQGNQENLEHSVHDFAGSLVPFHAGVAIEAALQLEAMGQRGDLTHAWETYKMLEEAVASLRPSLLVLGGETDP